VEYKNLLFVKEGALGIVTINRPDVLNALNMESYGELASLFEEIEKDNDVRVVIITGSGEKAFVAGADASELVTLNSVEVNKFIPIGRKPHDLIYNLSKPVIAAINGFALGGGCELTLCCDFRIAADNARFGHPEVNLGILPGGGGIQRMCRLVGMTKAKELAMTGDIIDADIALQIGLVNKVVPKAKLMEEARALADKLLSKSSITLFYIKRAFNSGLDMSLQSGLDSDECYFTKCFATEDQKEGMTAFIEKRKPDFKHR